MHSQLMNVFYIPAVEEVQKAPDQLSRLPKLTAANHNDVVLSVKGIALSLGDLKTLEPELMIREQNITQNGIITTIFSAQSISADTGY